MTEQYGVYAPPPEVPGAPLEPTPQPHKSRTGLIVAIVIIFVFLLCGCIAAAGLIFFMADTETTTETISTSAEDSPSATDEPADERMATWLAWDPATVEQLPGAPSKDAPLIADAVKILAPGFSARDTGYAAGWVDEAEDYYYGNLYLVRAVHPVSDKVSAALEFTLQSEEMIADDVPFETEEGDVVDRIAGGTVEMIHYGPFGNEDFPITSPEGEALWLTIGEDWPDAVVMRITTEAPDEVSVSLTKWRQYAIDDYSPRVIAVYQLDGDTWKLLGSEYESPSDDPLPDDEAPVT